MLVTPARAICASAFVYESLVWESQVRRKVTVSSSFAEFPGEARGFMPLSYE